MRLVALLIVAAIVGAGCGGGDAAQDTGGPAPEETVTVELGEANGSGQSGTATLTPKEGTIATFEVTISLSPPSGTPQLAAIHRVTCGEYEPKIPEDASSEEIFDAVSATSEDELGEVRGGSEKATVPGSLADRQTGMFSIIVHRPSPPFTPVVCGDIPARE